MIKREMKTSEYKAIDIDEPAINTGFNRYSFRAETQLSIDFVGLFIGETLTKQGNKQTLSDETIALLQDQAIAIMAEIESKKNI